MSVSAHCSHHGILGSKTQSLKCLIIGNDAESHIGGYFKSSASQLGLDYVFLNVNEGYSESAWINRIFWRFFGKRPVFLNCFSKKVLEIVSKEKINFVLVVGIAPLNEEVLKELEKRKVITVNYLTDDPFNPAHRANWFLKALPHYAHIATLRRGNQEDLQRHGCHNVFFLPFAYQPAVHYVDIQENEKDCADVAFVGGADRDRLGYFEYLAAEGFSLALYGGYWGRHPDLKSFHRGFANSETARRAIRQAKVCLCLVREANRDDNSMRTFEVAAMGGCMLLQDTPYHREVFGADGEAVAYFSNRDEMVSKLRLLISDQALRDKMREKSLKIIQNGRHTYLDRFQQILRRVHGQAL